MPERGYSTFVTDRGPWLVENVPDSPLAAWKTYNPLEYRNLHREFAEIELTPEGVQQFANRYGMLGRVVRFDKGIINGPMTEPVPFWLMHVWRMRLLLRLWDLCIASKPEEEKQVREMVTLTGFGASLRGDLEEGGDPWHYYPYPVFTEADQYVREKTIRTELEERHTDDFSYFVVGFLLLRQELNYELAEGVRPAINPSDFGSGVHLVPRDLLGAIYAVFAEETIGSSKARIKCPGCGIWFIQQDIRQRTCSKACKQRVWRASPDRKGTTNG